MYFLRVHAKSTSVMSDSLRPYGLQFSRFLCPWDSPGKNTGAFAMPFSRGSPWPRDWTSISYVSCTGKQPPEVKWKLLSHVWLFVTPWTTQSMKFSRPEYWSGSPFPSPGDLTNPGIKPISPALQADSLPVEPPGGRPIWEAPDFLHNCCLTAITMSTLPRHLHLSSQYNFLSLSTLDNFT